MIAQLLGLTPPPPTTARILEIGCASGGHIIPLAAQYPDARLVGIDLSAAQIASGLARVDRLGLANVELVRGDLVEFAPRPQTFDYVLCHGVYSWAPIEVRAAIQRLIAASLSPAGIAYVSYNVLPGWRLKQTLRDVLTSAVRHFPIWRRKSPARGRSWPYCADGAALMVPTARIFAAWPRGSRRSLTAISPTNISRKTTSRRRSASSSKRRDEPASPISLILICG